jgi:DNA-binding MarR family transcriptional regulator
MKSKTRPPSEIHRLLFMTAKRAHTGAERWFSRQKIGITPLQFGVLRLVGEKDMTLNELARRMMFKPPSILPSIDLLERKGYIARRNNPKDRRKIQLLMTAKGRRTVERITSSGSLDPLSIAFKRMSARKKKRLLALLTELSSNIKVDAL